MDVCDVTLHVAAIDAVPSPNGGADCASSTTTIECLDRCRTGVCCRLHNAFQKKVAQHGGALHHESNLRLRVRLLRVAVILLVRQEENVGYPAEFPLERLKSRSRPTAKSKL